MRVSPYPRQLQAFAITSLTIYSKNGVKYPRSMKAPPPMKNPIPPVISAIQKSINPGFNIYTYLRFFFIP